MVPPARSAEVEILLESREKLRRLARALVGEAWAEDVAQEACVRALERPPQCSGALGGWLSRVARHAALRLRARELARPEVERRGARPEAVLDRSEREERELELQSEVLRAVQALRQPYRSAVYMRYWQGLAPRRIARELGLPEATVKTRLRRGLELLRAELERKGARSALLGFAFPVLPLSPLAPGGAEAALVCKGLALMQKPLAAAGLVALATVVSVVWIAARPAGPDAAAPGPETALSPTGGAHAPAPSAADAAPLELAGAAGEGRTLEATPAPAPIRAAGEGAGIAGRVVDEAGRPVAGAEVRALHENDPFELGFEQGAFRWPTSEAVSGADGRFLVQALEEGPVQLVVEAAGFAPFRKDATAYLDLRTEVGDLALARGVRLSGRVVDSSGLPVAGAEIHAPRAVQTANVLRAGRDVRLAHTDASGRFTVDRHAVGPWTLVARSDGHPAGHASGDTQRAGESVEGIEIALPRGAEIRGRIAGLPAGAAASTWVRAGRADASSSVESGFVVHTSGVHGEHAVSVDESGEFALRGLDPGVTYRLGAYDAAESWRGRLRTRVAEAEAGASGVELPWLAPAALSFRVVDARTRAPLERFASSTGAFAFAPAFGIGAAREHEGGFARIDDVSLRESEDSGKVALRIAAEGYEAYAREGLNVTRGLTLDLGEIALEPLPLVRVRVRDEDGLPIEGARASLASPSEMSGMPSGAARMGRTVSSGPTVVGDPRGVPTDAEGRAALGAEPGASVRLRVRAKGWAPWESELFEMPLRGATELDVTLGRGGIVEVLVTDEAGTPVAGARVQHRRGADPDAARHTVEIDSGAARVTDSEGRAWFRWLAPGVHAFRLDGSGSGEVVLGGGGRTRMTFSARSAFEQDGKWTEVALAEGEQATLALSTGARTFLEGRVSERGEPLAGATLRLVSDPNDPRAELGGAPEATADARGAYLFENLEPGDYELVVQHESRALPHREPARVRAGGDRLDLDLDVTLARGVVKGEGGRPLAGARVRAERVGAEGRPARRVMMVAMSSTGAGDTVIVGGSGIGGSVETDAEGRFELRGLPSNAKLRLVATASGRSPARSRTFELAENEERSGLDLELLPGGAIEVAVHGAQGEPAAGVLVTARPSGDGEAPAVQITDAAGAARFEDLAPGRYAVSAQRMSPAGGEPTRREIDVPPGEPVRVRLDLP